MSYSVGFYEELLENSQPNYDLITELLKDAKKFNDKRILKWYVIFSKEEIGTNIMRFLKEKKNLYSYQVQFWMI